MDFEMLWVALHYAGDHAPLGQRGAFQVTKTWCLALSWAGEHRKQEEPGKIHIFGCGFTSGYLWLFSSDYKSFSRYGDERWSLCFGQPVVFPDRRRKQKSNSIFVHIFSNILLSLRVVDNPPSYWEPPKEMGHVLRRKLTFPWHSPSGQSNGLTLRVEASSPTVVA